MPKHNLNDGLGVSHIVSFRRPGQVRTVNKLTIPKHENPMAYARRLENLGYRIVDITPPIPQFVPTQRLENTGQHEFFRRGDEAPKSTDR